MYIEQNYIPGIDIIYFFPNSSYSTEVNIM